LNDDANFRKSKNFTVIQLDIKNHYFLGVNFLMPSKEKANFAVETNL